MDLEMNALPGTIVELITKFEVIEPGAKGVVLSKGKVFCPDLERFTDYLTISIEENGKAVGQLEVDEEHLTLFKVLKKPSGLSTIRVTKE